LKPENRKEKTPMNAAIPKEEITRRVESFRTRLTEAGLDGGLLNYAVDVYYFTGTRQNSVLWVPHEGPPVLLVRKSFRRAADEYLAGEVKPFPASRDLSAIIGQQARKIGLTFDVLPVQHFNFYRSLLPDLEFSDISAVNRDLRSVKSVWEIEQMRMSGDLLARAFAEIPGFLKLGMRELDLAAEFEHRLRRAGIGGYLRIRGFNQEITGIAVAGRNAAVAGCFDGPVTGRGHWTAAPYGPSTDPISEGLPIVIDYGGFYNGYIVDMTRIFCFGSIDPELEHAFRVSLEIQAWITKNLAPGAVCEDLFSGAAGMAADAGLGENFMGHPGEQAKFVGHGVGLELDELPVLAPRFKAPLRAGQVVAVEPKFLFPAKGAVGIENTFVVTEKGCDRLTTLPDEIICL
jgi:Xaa-Pro aminopeptidase